MRVDTRIETLYENLKTTMSRKRELWSAAHLSVFDEVGWADKPLIVRRAKAIELQLTHIPIGIEQGEILAGKIPLGSMWYGTTFPVYAKKEEIEEAGKWGMGLRSVWGHYVPDYSRVLRLGLKGIRSEAEKKMRVMDDSPANAPQRHFLEAVILSNLAVQKMAKRYQTLAELLAKTESHPQRKEDLREIASILQRVPEEPATTFHEAVQSFWLTFVALHSTMNSVPAGRLDFLLWPYLEADLKSGSISHDKAQEIVDCLWLKFNERNMFLEPEADEKDLIIVKQSSLMKRFLALYNHWLQNVMLGGLDEEGNDATNELTYMCLHATKKFNLTQPVISVRLHPGSAERLLALACEVIQTGAGMPSLYNDPVLIKALQDHGFSEKKARGYTNDGCWEILIPGETEFRWGPIHTLQCLEFALNNGKSRIFSESDQATLHMPVTGIETGDPKSFTTYDDVWHAFLKQLDHQMDNYMAKARSLFGRYSMLVPVPFLSSLIDGCLENARDITEGGARSYVNAMLLTGLPNAADALTAVKTLVFEQGKVNWADLLTALECNFDGFERLRQFLMNRSPNYGNDMDVVDRIAAEIVRYYVERMKLYREKYLPLTFVPGVGTFEDYDLFGRMVGATPDGRKSGTTLAPNLGPVPGMDLHGPTALLHSYNKIDHASLAAGAELDISMNARDFRGEEGLKRLIGFVRAFLKTQGAIVNIALNDAEILKKAQMNPEQHKDLRVRMGGWSAYFVLLDKRNQDHQIARYSR